MVPHAPTKGQVDKHRADQRRNGQRVTYEKPKGTSRACWPISLGATTPRNTSRRGKAIPVVQTKERKDEAT